MICTDTDNCVNVQSTIKKETKSPVLFKLFIYSIELAAVILFEEYCLKYKKAFPATPFFHGECVNLTILQQQLQFFFYLGFLSRTSRFTREQEQGEINCLPPLYHFYLLCRHLNISRATTAENSPLHVGSIPTRTEDL